MLRQVENVSRLRFCPQRMNGPRVSLVIKGRVSVLCAFHAKMIFPSIVPALLGTVLPSCGQTPSWVVHVEEREGMRQTGVRKHFSQGTLARFSHMPVLEPGSGPWHTSVRGCQPGGLCLGKLGVAAIDVIEKQVVLKSDEGIPGFCINEGSILIRWRLLPSEQTWTWKSRSPGMNDRANMLFPPRRHDD